MPLWLTPPGSRYDCACSLDGDAVFFDTDSLVFQSDRERSVLGPKGKETSMQTNRFVLIATLTCACALVANAQETRGTIIGQVVDASGAVVPGANVTAANIESDVTQKTVTNNEGAYEFVYMLPGKYTVSASAKGFKTTLQEVQVLIHERIKVDLTLEVGVVAEQVKITAEAQQLQTANANLGQVIEGRRVAELPLHDGTPYSIIFFTTGVADSGYGRLYQTPNNMDGASQGMSVNGTPMGTTSFMVDGTVNTQLAHGAGPMSSPSADLVEELKLETAFDASVGHTAGLVINVALKTGTNTLHGSAYGFFRNRDWDANTFFANRAGQTTPNYDYHHWGATLTGPVYLPKIYDGRNRTFFSFGYDHIRDVESDASINSVPNTKNAGGDFSNLLALNSSYQIYDPATIKAAGNGRFSRDPFPGNIIPASRISPIAQNILKHYPAPNATGTADGTNNWDHSNGTSPDNNYGYLFRIDHNTGNINRLFVRGTIGRRLTGPYRPYWDDIAVGENFVSWTRAGAFDDVITLTPTTVLNFRYGYSRFQSGHVPRKTGFDVTQLGFPAQTVQQLQAQVLQFPTVNISGLTGLGREGQDVSNNDVHSIFAGVSRQQGNHALKVGLDITQSRVNIAVLNGPGGTFTFDTTYTRGPVDNSAGSPGGVGQGLAALLLGLPSTGSVSQVASQAIQSTNYAIYIQDNWRATRKLTFDLGLRWEYEQPYSERYNRSVRGFNPGAALPIAGAAQAAYAANPDPALPVNQFRVQGGLLFAGVGGVSNQFWDASGKFAPRFGFAYHVHPKIVLRGGFGIFPFARGYNPSLTAQSFAIQTGFSQSTALVPTLDNGLNFVANLAAPFPSGITPPSGSSQGAATFLGQAISYYNPAYPTPYTTQWNFNIQNMLPGQFLLEVGYTGTHSIRQPLQRSMDAIPNQYLSASPTRDQSTINYLTAQIPNPFAGLLPGTGLNTATIARNQLLLPLPQFTGVTMNDYQGFSRYNALQVRVERRFSAGFTLLSGYTFSKNIAAENYYAWASGAYINAGDPTPTRAIAGIDQTHMFTITAIYELPFGKGKPLLNNISRLANAFVGGWQLSGVETVHSGVPLAFGNVLFTGNIKDIAIPGSQQKPEHWFNTSGFVTNPAQQLAFNLRTFPIRLSNVRTGHYNSQDISLLKNITIHERHHFQYRFEVYNAFNHPTAFTSAVTDPTSSAFGQVTDMWSLARQLQMGVKYLF
jgi:hypothetical protein